MYRLYYALCRIALVFFLLLLNISSRAQVVLNEICPTNINGITNHGNYDDWIELYNAGSSSVNLLGYGLSNDSLELTKFVFGNYTLAAGGFVIVFTSDSNANLLVNHWETAVQASTTWKYFVGNSQPDTNWRNPSFNSSAWSSGGGGIGYGDGDDVTIVPACYSEMMLKTFNVPDTTQILAAILNIDYDDAFVAYLNGVEIARANLGTPGNRPAYNVLATTSHEALMYQGLSPDSFFIDPVLLRSCLKQGTNVLAIEVHNDTPTSSDMTSRPYLTFGMRSSGMTFSTPPSFFHAPSQGNFNAKFKMSRSGETIYFSNPSHSIIDSRTFSNFNSDNSTGRQPNGNSHWCYFSTPTPATSNNSQTCYTNYASIPLFSLNAGFYPSSQWLTLTTTTPGGVIRYTTNGNDPTSSSTRFTAAILINRTMVVRAKVFATGYLTSQTITNSYFINDNVHLPVFTISTDSLNLYDYNTGIYVMGPNADPNYPYKNANFWQDWKKLAAIEYYDKQKNRILKFNAEIGIYGNYSRAKPQKSFEISLSDRYGTGSMDYPLIPDKPYLNNMNDIVLRNSGSDWNVVHFRDAYMERVLKKTRTGYIGTEPAVMYLNGQFWGVYTIHENHDHHWMEFNFGYSKDQIDYMKEYGSTIEVKNGSATDFWTMYNYATTQNATTQQYYNYMNTAWDLGNYTDYFIAETYYNNGDWIGDWTNNIKIWRPHIPATKWRYLVYDLDFGLAYAGSVNDNRLDIAIHPPAFSYSSNVFASFLNNPTFKHDFINRYADLVNTIFLPSNMNSVMHQFKDSMAFDMTRHFNKWGSTTSAWNNNINVMMSFVNARPAIARNQVQSEFGLAGQVTLTLNSSPAAGGRIQISTITPYPLPWSGVYFNGNTVTITAIPNPGYTFNHWHSAHVISTNDTHQSTTYNFNQTDQITAYFTGSAVTAHINISEINYHSDSTLDAGDWVELHNFGTQSTDISGWSFMDENDNHRFTFPVNTVIAAGGYLVIAEDLAKFSAQHPGITNVTGPMSFNLSNAGEQVRLKDFRDTLYLSIYYQDTPPWPVLADGSGYTCELSTNTGNPNDGNNWFAGCIGGSPGRAFGGTLNVPVSVTGNTTFCAGGSVNLHATVANGYTYQWQRNHSNISGATSSTLHVTTAGTFNVVVTYQGCSSISDSTEVTVVTQGPQPVVNSDSRCGSGTLTLIATSSDTVYWFDSPGGTLLSVGDTLVTPLLSSTTTYYAQTSLSCPSTPVAVPAVINLQAAAPVTNDIINCGPGSVTLLASDTATIRWYTSAGAMVASGPSFTTQLIQADSLFYVEAGIICPSSRISVQVTIKSTPPPVVFSQSHCGSGSLLLIALSSDTIHWFDALSGGNLVGTGSNFITPVLGTTTLYYAEADSVCASPRMEVDAIINNIPNPPIASDTFVCGPGPATLMATASEQIFWFSSPADGTEIGSGSFFTTPLIATPSTFYVETGYICRSTRIPVTVTVNSVSPMPQTTDAVRCGPGTVTVIANSPETITWYDDSLAGNLVYSGDVFLTPVLSQSTTFYAAAGTSCPSRRVSSHVVIEPVSVSPVVTIGTTCGSGSITLQASAPDSIFWYDLPVNGTLLGTGSTFQTPVLNFSSIYVVIAGTECPSPPVMAQAIVYPQPVMNLGPDSITISSGQSLVLDAGAGFASYLWSNGSHAQTISVGSTNTYTVTVTDVNGCSATDSVFVSVITGLQELQAAFSFSLIPNPVQDHFTVQVTTPKSDHAEIRVLDATGRLLRIEEVQLPAGHFSRAFDVAGIESGVYFIRIETRDFSRILKFIVE